LSPRIYQQSRASIDRTGRTAVPSDIGRWHFTDGEAFSRPFRAPAHRQKLIHVERLAKYLHVKPARVMAEYVVQSEEEGLILRRDQKTGCVFLSGNECTIYDARPEGCQKFPHVVRGNGSIVSRMWELIDRACYCPIVYNSLEAFKDEMGFKR
jgi:Fe-S-cluster containining protein